MIIRAIRKGNLVTKSNYVEIVCVVDKSGSMGMIESDAIGGFNHFLGEQKKLPGDARFTLALFDHEYEIAVDAVDIQHVPPLNETTYCPRGSTALLDAIGKTVTAVGERLSKTPAYARPSKVIVAILTDGLENASKEYTRSKMFEMIKHQREVYSWEFIFLAANQNAIQEGASLGINMKDSFNFNATGLGVRTAYRCMAQSVASYRTNADPQVQELSDTGKK